MTCAYRDSDDGQGWSFMLERPFYPLDTRWSTGLACRRTSPVEPVYRLGEQVAGYGRKAEFGEFQLRPLAAGCATTGPGAFIFGFRREHAEFDFAPDETAPAALPEDRHLDYPFVRIEGVQDDFETTQNRDQIARTEDLHFGMHYALELGYSTPALGADRERGPACTRRRAADGGSAKSNSMFADAAIDRARRKRCGGRYPAVDRLALLPRHGTEQPLLHGTDRGEPATTSMPIMS